ncbi:MAG: hypothetical protein AB8H12_20400 [Lewinella sp.]
MVPLRTFLFVLLAIVTTSSLQAQLRDKIYEENECLASIYSKLSNVNNDSIDASSAIGLVVFASYSSLTKKMDAIGYVVVTGVLTGKVTKNIDRLVLGNLKDIPVGKGCEAGNFGSLLMFPVYISHPEHDLYHGTNVFQDNKQALTSMEALSTMKDATLFPIIYATGFRVR